MDTTLGEFVIAAEAGRVSEVEVDNNKLTYKRVDDDVTFSTKMEKGDTVRQILTDAGLTTGQINDINVKIKEASSFSNIFGIFINFLPIIFIVAILFLFSTPGPGQQFPGHELWQESCSRVRQHPVPASHSMT